MLGTSIESSVTLSVRRCVERYCRESKNGIAGTMHYLNVSIRCTERTMKGVLAEDTVKYTQQNNLRDTLCNFPLCEF